MSDKKTIIINPSSFKVSSFETNTRKNRKKPTERKIKVKSKDKPKNNKTLKRNLIKMIRTHQQQKLKRKSDDYSNKHSEDISVSKSEFSNNDEIVNFKNDFSESLDFLTALTKKTEDKQKLANYHNKTIRNYSAADSLNVAQTQEPFVNLNVPDALTVNPVNVINDIVPIADSQCATTVNYNHYKPSHPPPYGCLKNGSLPLYRNWKNSTQKNQHPITNDDDADNRYVQKPPVTIDSVKLAHMNHMRSKIKPFLNKKKKQRRCKKTTRRTFRVGRSKVRPSISVLVSNRTIRNNITTKKQLLKQIPIEEVKKYLINHGFIRIGTNSPNDVLRKMYETASMVCGEIHNHNPEHIIYNYMNTKDEF
jgi:hypothetical protein